MTHLAAWAGELSRPVPCCGHGRWSTTQARRRGVQ